MTSEQFCYWLQGRAEMQPDKPPSDAEWKMIREHLVTVFVKVTPQLGDGLRKIGPDHHIAPFPAAPDLSKLRWQPPLSAECSVISVPGSMSWC